MIEFIFTSSKPHNIVSSLFGSMKQELREKCYGSDEEANAAVRNWLHKQPVAFYEAGIHVHIRR